MDRVLEHSLPQLDSTIITQFLTIANLHTCLEFFGGASTDFMIVMSKEMFFSIERTSNRCGSKRMMEKVMKSFSYNKLFFSTRFLYLHKVESVKRTATASKRNDPSVTEH